MGSAEGRRKAEATRLGLSWEEYTARVEAGLRHCSACREWHPREVFGRDAGNVDGLHSMCREQANRAAAESRARTRRKRARASRPGDPVPGLGGWVWTCEVCGLAYQYSTELAARSASTRHRRDGLGCPAALRDDVETYLAGGETLHTAAARHGVSVDSLSRSLRRYGFYDLLDRLWGTTDVEERARIGQEQSKWRRAA